MMERSMEYAGAFHGLPQSGLASYQITERVATSETSFTHNDPPVTQQPQLAYNNHGYIEDRPGYYAQSPLPITEQPYQTQGYNGNHDLRYRNPHERFDLQDGGYDKDTSDDKPRKIPRSATRVILTRIVAAIFILFDCGSDWYQYFQMHNNQSDAPDHYNMSGYKNITNSKIVRISNCTDTEDITSKYMYFSIAGSVIALIQVINIIYQIRCEVLHRKNKSKEPNTRMGAKFLDGKTESFYNVLLIEFPQAVLLLLYQNACFSICDIDFSQNKKSLKKRLFAAGSGSVAVVSNCWRYFTSLRCCDDDQKPSKKSGGGSCCGACCKCCCKYCCCCCYACFKSVKSCIDCCFCCCMKCERTFPFCCCGKKCVCDKCSPSLEPYSWNCGVCCFNMICCPLKDQTNGVGFCCCRIENTCCRAGSVSDSYDAFVLHKYLGGVVNIANTALQFFSICQLFCLFSDNLIGTILTWMVKTAFDNILATN